MDEIGRQERRTLRLGNEGSRQEHLKDIKDKGDQFLNVTKKGGYAVKALQPRTGRNYENGDADLHRGKKQRIMCCPPGRFRWGVVSSQKQVAKHGWLQDLAKKRKDSEEKLKIQEKSKKMQI